MPISLAPAISITTCHSRNPMVAAAASPPSHLKNLKRIKSEVYEGFSHVFSVDSSQEEVYERMVKPLVEDFINGKSGMLATLGPSGSGKTHTVFGCPREPGMVPLALQQIFKRTEGSGSEATGSFYISIFEIYSERGKWERRNSTLARPCQLGTSIVINSAFKCLIYCQLPVNFCNHEYCFSRESSRHRKWISRIYS